MSDDILDQIKTGVTQDMADALTNTSLTRLEMHSITQSYLMLQILDRLERIEPTVATGHNSPATILLTKDQTRKKIEPIGYAYDQLERGNKRNERAELS